MNSLNHPFRPIFARLRTTWYYGRDNKKDCENPKIALPLNKCGADISFLFIYLCLFIYFDFDNKRYAFNMVYAFTNTNNIILIINCMLLPNCV